MESVIISTAFFLIVAVVAVPSVKAIPGFGIPVEEQDDREPFAALGPYAGDEPERQLQEEERSVFVNTLSLDESLPETSNFDAVAQPFCQCCCNNCCNKKKKKNKTTIKIKGGGNAIGNGNGVNNGNGNFNGKWNEKDGKRPNDDSDDDEDRKKREANDGWRWSSGNGKLSERAKSNSGLRITVLGSRVELKLYSTLQDLTQLYNSDVVRGELYERPLDKDTEPAVAKSLKGKQSAVVTTLSDGRRFLVVKGNQKGEGSETIAIIADHMTDDWVKVSTSTITRSTLGDFIKAGGFEYDPLLDNGRSAAMRMMVLD